MIKTIKRNIRFLLGIKNDTDYYSQGGEDAIASHTFSYVVPTQNGFYIDIGAYHPYKHSNTYILHKAGWRGMNIDPRPGIKKLFDRYRPNDINIEAGIGSEDKQMTYYILEEDQKMNSFSKESLEKLGAFESVKRTIDVPVYTLDSLLKKYPDIKNIDYLNIDAEGFEMEILSGLNFEKLKPKVISIEQNDVFTFADVFESSVCNFLSQKGFTPYAKNIILKNISTIFYIQNDCCQ